MVQTFTQNDIIKALYHELPASEMVHLEEQLENDTEIQNNFEDLNVLKLKLDSLVLEPSMSVISSILDYSRSYKK
jgi:hypothetical protein